MLASHFFQQLFSTYIKLFDSHVKLGRGDFAGMACQELRSHLGNPCNGKGQWNVGVGPLGFVAMQRQP